LSVIPAKAGIQESKSFWIAFRSWDLEFFWKGIVQKMQETPGTHEKVKELESRIASDLVHL